MPIEVALSHIALSDSRFWVRYNSYAVWSVAMGQIHPPPRTSPSR